MSSGIGGLAFGEGMEKAEESGEAEVACERREKAASLISSLSVGLIWFGWVGGPFLGPKSKFFSDPLWPPRDRPILSSLLLIKVRTL